MSRVGSVTLKTHWLIILLAAVAVAAGFGVCLLQSLRTAATMRAAACRNMALSRQLLTAQAAHVQATTDSRAAREELEELRGQLEISRRSAEEPVKALPSNVLAVYGFPSESDEDVLAPPVVIHCVPVPAEASMLHRLRLVAERTSQLNFNGARIDAKQITFCNHRLIALVNLTESPEPGRRWEGGYFGGATGGGMTRRILEASLLQPDFSGPWVDAVRFRYNGARIGDPGCPEDIYFPDIVTRESVRAYHRSQR